MRYTYIKVDTALSKTKSKNIPYKWNLNVYRGCEHRCIYCYARYSNKYLGSRNYFDDIFIKKNVVEVLEKKLSSKSWKPELINLGNVTDNYQVIEEKEKIMPEILKLLIKYKTPCTISTKSDLILRDFELFEQLAEVSYVNIAVSIMSCDEKLRRNFEPSSSSIKKRLEVIKAFSNSKVSTGIHMMPIIPYITDSYENFENIFYRGSELGVDYIRPFVLNLVGSTRMMFLDFLACNYKNLYYKLIKLFETQYAPNSYITSVNNQLKSLYAKYSVNEESPILKKCIEQEEDFEQLSFFFDP